MNSTIFKKHFDDMDFSELTSVDIAEIMMNIASCDYSSDNRAALALEFTNAVDAAQNRNYPNFKRYLA